MRLRSWPTPPSVGRALAAMKCLWSINQYLIIDYEQWQQRHLTKFAVTLLQEIVQSFVIIQQRFICREGTLCGGQNWLGGTCTMDHPLWHEASGFSTMQSTRQPTSAIRADMIMTAASVLGGWSRWSKLHPFFDWGLKFCVQRELLLLLSSICFMEYYRPFWIVTTITLVVH